MDKPIFSFQQTSETNKHRPRRLRYSAAVRNLVEETRLSASQLVMPYFVKSGLQVKEPIQAMPGQYRFSVDQLLFELEEIARRGVKSILLFGLPDEKDSEGSEAWSERGVVQQAIGEIKKRFPQLCVISDVCLCAYTSHGHCGVLNEKGQVDNDPSLELLAKVALSHAQAGADIIAPSDMMDGRVRKIRETLDENQLAEIPILSYAVKYASSFYGPFRDAAHSAPGGDGHVPVPKDRKSYQMNPANREEALREAALDLQEGADLLMVKPALAYLDIIRDLRQNFPVPIAAYSVSGEYLMIKSAAFSGYMDEKSLVLESLTSMSRAGAQILITYHAKEVSAWLSAR